MRTKRKNACNFYGCYAKQEGETLHFGSIGASVIEFTFDNCKYKTVNEGESGSGMTLSRDSSSKIIIMKCQSKNYSKTNSYSLTNNFEHTKHFFMSKHFFISNSFSSWKISTEYPSV